MHASWSWAGADSLSTQELVAHRSGFKRVRGSEGVRERESSCSLMYD